MKAVILAGGLGTRMSEETHSVPKPMVQIGGKPILWHIMKIYSHYGINDFVICLGYRGYMIKEYFANYYLHTSDVTICTATNDMEIHRSGAEDWRVTLIDTGQETLTGGRLKRVQNYIGDDDCFLFTYGDGVADIDITDEIAFHRQHGKLATIAGVKPPGRFGALEITDNEVTGFHEKAGGDGNWINGGFFVLSPKVIDLISDDQTVWEHEPLESLATSGNLQVYYHEGFWQPMDMLREKTILNKLWATGNAPWKLWDD